MMAANYGTHCQGEYAGLRAVTSRFVSPAAGMSLPLTKRVANRSLHPALSNDSSVLNHSRRNLANSSDISAAVILILIAD